MINLVAVVLILASLDQAKSAQGSACLGESDKFGIEYRGDVSVMTTGQVCQRWDSNTPHSTTFMRETSPNAGLDENYCRNPDDDVNGPWCYNSEGSSPEYGSCTVPKCGESCSKPIIENGMVSPDRLAIESGASYSVTCDATFEISGSPTINCEGFQLSELPTCEPVSENDGNDNGETQNENNHDYSGAGYTNISTILFGTLMCKIVMIY